MGYRGLAGYRGFVDYREFVNSHTFVDDVGVLWTCRGLLWMS